MQFVEDVQHLFSRPAIISMILTLLFCVSSCAGSSEPDVLVSRRELFNLLEMGKKGDPCLTYETDSVSAVASCKKMGGNFKYLDIVEVAPPCRPMLEPNCTKGRFQRTYECTITVTNYFYFCSKRYPRWRVPITKTVSLRECAQPFYQKFIYNRNVIEKIRSVSNQKPEP